MCYEGYDIISDMREYILTVTGAVAFCSVLRSIIPAKIGAGRLLKIITGVFIITVIISPVLKVKYLDLERFLENTHVSSTEIVEAGQEITLQSMQENIKSNIEAYILNKASNMGIVLSVDVVLNDSNPPVPTGVTLKGKISPYHKRILESMIEEDINIPKGNQIWI